MRKLLVALATVAVLTSAAIGQIEKGERSDPSANPPKPPSVQEMLDSPAPEVSLEEVPFEQVMEWLADYTDLNIWVRWQVLADSGVERDRPISLKGRNLRVSQVLWMILTEAGGPGVKLAYGTVENVLVVSTRNDLSEELIVRAYDVHDLLARVPHFENAVRVNPARALDPTGQGSSGAITEPSQAEPEDELEQDLETFVDLIIETVEPDSWAANGGRGTIRAWRGKIIVRNSLYVHQQLGGTLRQINGR
jgi:hypothetical protein